MKTQPRCAGCVLDDVAGAAERLGLDAATTGRVMRRSLEHLAASFDGTRVPSEHITEVHRILKREASLPLPFAELRRRCNEAGLALAAELARELAPLAPPERFALLVRWAIAANHLDMRTVGVGYGISGADAAGILRAPFDEGLAVDDTAAIREAAAAARTVLYVHDNVGEVAVDVLLVRELRALGARVVSALRGGPITSDATLEDGAAVGIGGAADEVICACPDTLGISFPEMTPGMRRAVAEADLVVSKGQANYYVLDEHRAAVPGAIAFLLRTKCPPVSRRFGHERPINVAALDRR